MITGSCLCGNVKYEVSGKVGAIVHCHCNTCRKVHGAAFSSVIKVADADFELKGGKYLNSFESSKGKLRYFCSNCGSHVFAKRDDSEHVVLRLGSLDDYPQSAEEENILDSQKINRCSIKRDLPEYSKFECESSD